MYSNPQFDQGIEIFFSLKLFINQSWEFEGTINIFIKQLNT